MKNLSIERWQQAYRHDLPSYHQRYWLQLWLEMLDPDTDYLYDFGTTDIITLLHEFAQTPPVVQGQGGRAFDNARTLFFLMSELQYQFKNDLVIRPLLGSEQVDNLLTSITDLVEKAKNLFDLDGSTIVGTNRKSLQQEWIDAVITFRNSKLTSPLQKITYGKTYLEENQKQLGMQLSQVVNRHNINHEMATNKLTSGLLLNLVVRESYSPSYLADSARTTFLETSPATFLRRLDGYFNSLRSDKRSFHVMMRIQTKKELRQVRQIGPIAISESMPDMIHLIDRLAKHAQMERKEIKPAKEFFLHGSKSERMIFASALNIEAEGPGKAAAFGIQALNTALQQVRFEFELSSFSLDNNIYIYDPANYKLIPFTRRQAIRKKYGKKGNPKRLEHIIWKLEYAKKTRVASPPVVDKVTNLALQWHQHAMDATSAEVRFMNHWIALEQIFKSPTISVPGRNSAGDILSLTLASAVKRSYPYTICENLWGDMVRCGFMGPKPIMCHHTGVVHFKELLYERLDPISHVVEPPSNEHLNRKHRDQRPADLLILSDQGRFKKCYRIDDGFRMFATDNQRIKSGDWIAGLPIDNNEKTPHILQELFYGQTPSLENLVYLWRHHVSDIVRQAKVHGLDTKYKHLSDSVEVFSPTVIGEYHRLEALVSDIVECIDMRVLGLGRFEIREAKMSTPEVLSATVDVWGDWDDILRNFGWTEKSSLRGRLRAVQQQRLLLNQTFRAYVALKEFGRDLLNNPNTHSENRLTIIPGLLKELFRGQSPNWDAFGRILNDPLRTEDLVHACPNQPLLRSRIYQATTALRSDPPPAHQYVWELDRMRRTRNNLVHTARQEDAIELVTRRLYRWSRIYLTQVLNRIVNSDGYSSNDIFGIT